MASRRARTPFNTSGVAPQVVFEIFSPGNRFGEMSAKFDFYRRHGVEEYYIYNPDPIWMELSGFLRRQDDLVEIPSMHGHISPRLTVNFEMGDAGLRILRPDGQPFVTFQEMAIQREKERKRADRLQAELDRLRCGSGVWWGS